MIEKQIGERIRRFRLDRALRQEDLAEVLGLDTSAVSKIETGARKVSGRELIRLSKLLGVGSRDILGTRRPQPALQMAYRLTQDENGDGDRSAIIEALEIHALLEQVEARPVTMSRPKAVNPERLLNGEDSGKRAAQLVREALGLGLAPLHKVEDIIEQMIEGASVLGRPLGPDSLSGMCVVTEGLTLVFVNTSKAATRQRFTLAHELAHLLFRDTTGGTLEDTDTSMSDSSAGIEVRANSFAAELLVPTAAAAAAHERVRGDVAAALATLVFEYGVSRQTAAIALQRAGVSDGITEANSMQRYVLAHRFGYSDVDESLRAQIDRTIAPKLLYRRAAQAWIDGLIGAGPLAALSGRDTDEVREELLHLQQRAAEVADGA